MNHASNKHRFNHDLVSEILMLNFESEFYIQVELIIYNFQSIQIQRKFPNNAVNLVIRLNSCGRDTKEKILSEQLQ